MDLKKALDSEFHLDENKKRGGFIKPPLFISQFILCDLLFKNKSYK